MKKVNLIFILLGMFLLSSVSNAELLGDICDPSDRNDTFITAGTTVYNGTVTTGSSETFYFRILRAGTLVLTPLSDGNKANIASSTNSCPVIASSTAPITITVTEPTDINVLIYGTGDRAYTLTAEFTPVPMGLFKSNFPTQVEVDIDSNITYTLTAVNYSDANLTTIEITDTLPGEVVTVRDLRTDPDPSGLDCNITPSTPFILTCTGSLEASEITEIIIDVTVHPTSTGDIINTATMTDDSTTPVTASSILESVSGTKPVDLQIQKFAEADTIPPDTNFTYVVFVINHSQSADAELVKVTDIFPLDENVSFVSYDRGSGWDCDITDVENGTNDTFTCLFDRSMGHEITYFTITAHTDAGDYNTTATNEVNVTALNPVTGDHDINASATITIADLNGTRGGFIGGQYFTGGPVEVSTIGLSLDSARAGAFLQTKVASTIGETLGTYTINSSEEVDEFQDVTRLDEGNTKLVPLTVILKLGNADCYMLDEPHLSYDRSRVVAVFEGTDFSVPAEDPRGDDGNFDLRNIAIRDARIIMQYIDINAKLDDANETCRISSVDGNIPGLPQCLTNAAGSNKFDNNKYIKTFGIEAFVRCAIQNGQPCSSENNGYGDDPYDSEYGCYECTLGSSGSCSRDHFAIRPKAFDVDILDQVLPLRAGKPYDLSFRGLTANAATLPPETAWDYNETQILRDSLDSNRTFYVDANVTNNSQCQIKSLTITPSVHFRDGLHNDEFSFNDIGDINFSIHERIGYEFAKIDVNDTPLLEDRLIEEFNITFSVIPNHFNIEANLTDHNSDSNFTYLHDINQYEDDDNYSMAAALTIDIEARGDDENITYNYTEHCYAKETNLTLAFSSTNITFPGYDPALTQFLYYNPLEDDGTPNSGEGEHNFTTTTSPISIPSLPIENIVSSFPADAPDGNGTTHIEYKLNFDRKMHLEVDPFRMALTDVNITDEDNVEGNQTGIPNQNATMLYARSRASKFFYEDITGSSVNTPILIDVYCSLGFTACEYLSINTIAGQINEADWWLSINHKETTQDDGNITLEIDLPSAITEGDNTDTPTVDTDVTVDSQGRDDTIFVTSNATDLPMTVEIDLVTDNTLTNYTNTWLIYNPETDSILQEPPSPFYKVRFINTAGWTGVGETGHVLETNASSTKTKRLDW